MDNNAKLDKIFGLLETILDKQQEHDERFEELREALVDRNLPGSGYNTFEAIDDEE